MIKRLLFNILLATLVVSKNIDLSEDATKAHNECVEELGINITDKELMLKDMEEKCYSKCVYLKLGMMDKKGNIILTKYPDRKIDAEQCEKASKTGDACKRASAFAKCLLEIMIQHEMEMIKDCAKETNTSLKITKDENQYDEKRACLDKCIFTKKGFLIGDNINVENLKKVSKSVTDQTISDCQTKNKDGDACLKPVKITYCIFQKMQK